MALDVRVQRAIVYDDAQVEAALGEVPLPLGHAERVLAPFITIDGRIHGLTSNFLRHHCLAKPEVDTATRIASDLVGWVDFLVNHRGRHPFEGHRDPESMLDRQTAEQVQPHPGAMVRVTTQRWGEIGRTRVKPWFSKTAIGPVCRNEPDTERSSVSSG